MPHKRPNLSGQSLLSQFIGPRYRRSLTYDAKRYPYICPQCRLHGELKGLPNRSALRAHLRHHRASVRLAGGVT